MAWGRRAGVKSGHLFFCSGVSSAFFGLAGLGLLEAVAVAVHFQDVDVMCQAVEQGAG